MTVKALLSTQMCQQRHNSKAYLICRIRMNACCMGMFSHTDFRYKWITVCHYQNAHQIKASYCLQGSALDFFPLYFLKSRGSLSSGVAYFRVCQPIIEYGCPNSDTCLCLFLQEHRYHEFTFTVKLSVQFPQPYLESLALMTYKTWLLLENSAKYEK